MERPGSVAQHLSISPATLRAWSVEFGEFLSDSARTTLTDGPGHAQRRYTADDIAILRRAKSLLSSGLTYAETRDRLSQPPEPAAPSADTSDPVAPTESPDSEATSALALPPEVQMMIVALRREAEAHNAHVETLQRQLEREQERADRAEGEVTELRRALVGQMQQPAPERTRHRWWEFWKRGSSEKGGVVNYLPNPPDRSEEEDVRRYSQDKLTRKLQNSEHARLVKEAEEQRKSETPRRSWWERLTQWVRREP